MRSYEINNPLGQFKVHVGSGIYQIEIQADGYAPQWSQEINLDYENTTHMALSAGGHITGLVLDTLGKPISGAQVIPLSRACGARPGERQLFMNMLGAATTIDGRFIMRHLAPGVETLKIIHPDHAPRVTKNIEIFENQATRNIVITLESGGSFEGTVYDGKGNPQPKQRLLFLEKCESMQLHLLQYRHTHQLGTAVTDSNGYYFVEHLPEKLCTVYRVNHDKASGIVRCTATPINGTIQRLDLGGAALSSLSGNIELNGKPLVNRRLLLASIDSHHYGNPMCFATTDEYGSFVFRGISPHFYAIYLKEKDQVRQFTKITTVEVKADDLDVGVINFNSRR